MEFYHETARHCPKAYDYFKFDNLDAFYSEDILNVIYGSNWESILITDNEMAFFHTFSKNKIDGTDQFDIEPFLGYSGPVVNTDDIDFINRSTRIYSCFCLENNIIAEVIRFNPIAENHIPFEKNGSIKIIPVKEIVIVDCLKDETEQLRQFKAKSARYMINKAKKNCLFRELDKPTEFKLFIELYNKSLKANHADKKWFFSAEFYKRILQADSFKPYGVFHEGKLTSVSLVIPHSSAAYYFLAANAPEFFPGSNELLIFHINRITAFINIPYLILGGGNSISPEDRLLQFKKKFSRKTYKFHIGKMIHNRDVYNEMCIEAININSTLKERNYHLKYRLLVS